MGDDLKLNKDKRHRSSSSIVAVTSLEGSRSESKKLDIKGSITEADDQFALADARCDDLQDKLDLVKSLKRKKKLKKRSTTRVTESLQSEEIPLMSIRTQPKKKLFRDLKSKIAPVVEAPPQVQRFRRLEQPSNPTRAYVDPATVEQHRMLDQVLLSQDYKPLNQRQRAAKPHDMGMFGKPRMRRAHADGDNMAVPRPPLVMKSRKSRNEVACGEDVAEDLGTGSDQDVYEASVRSNQKMLQNPAKATRCQKDNSKLILNRRRHVPRDIPLKEANHQLTMNTSNAKDDRPVVELFKKNLSVQPPDFKRPSQCIVTEKKPSRYQELLDDPTDFDSEKCDGDSRKKKQPRRLKYRSRRYELPTVASQMKQAGMRYCYQTQPYYTNIPFIISKSTAPSHNIGVNIQQVLNGLKIQQPLSGIPLTIAHHMGLGHIPSCESNITQLSLDNREMNAIRLGRRLLRLPSYKYISYNRLLSLYRESDGMVSRFLRALGRTHSFYTSMYNLATRVDFDGTNSAKTRLGNNEAKQSLAEYANLYHEYEKVDKSLNEKHDEDLERRKEMLVNELAAREEQIRRLVQTSSPTSTEHKPLRASASTAEDNYRYSTFKLNAANAP